MSNIVLTQPGGAGTLTTDGNVQVGIRCYLAATGNITALSWTLLSAPAGSTASVKLGSHGYYFDPDVRSETPYVVQLTDILSATYTNSFSASSRPVAPSYAIPSDPLYAEWFGVKANGREVTDGILVADSNIFQSAMANFSLADEGRSFLIRAANTRGAGLLSTSSGSTTVQGASTTFLTDLPKIAGDPASTYQPASGGAIYITGVGYVIAQYADAGVQQLYLYQGAPGTVASAAWYADTQLTGTIVKYLSPTQVQLSVAATISETSVTAYFGTDDTTALDDAIRFAFDHNVRALRLPGGNVTISSNLVYTNRSALTIFGPAATKCTLQDIRKISSEVTYPNLTLGYGALSFNGCDGISLRAFGYNSRMPAIGVVHSAGGSVNNSGSRVGFYFHVCTNSSVVEMRSDGFGARDEHVQVDGQSTNFLADSCVIVGNNNVSINVNGGFDGSGNPIPNGVRVTQCTLTGLLAACGTLLVDHCDLTTYGDARLSGGLTLSHLGHTIIDSNVFHDFNLLNAGTSALDVFGTVSANSSLSIINNIFVNLNGLWDAGHGAIIKLLNPGGTTLIFGNVVDRCTSNPAGRFVSIEGVSTDKVFIGPNNLRGRVACGMTIGYYVDAAVPTSAVTIAPGSFFGESITTPWSLGATCEIPTDFGYCLQERSDPPSPIANRVVFYARDNGSGKTQLCAIFPTGAVQVVAAEP